MKKRSRAALVNPRYDALRRNASSDAPRPSPDFSSCERKDAERASRRYDAEHRNEKARRETARAKARAARCRNKNQGRISFGSRFGSAFGSFLGSILGVSGPLGSTFGVNGPPFGSTRGVCGMLRHCCLMRGREEEPSSHRESGRGLQLRGTLRAWWCEWLLPASGFCRRERRRHSQPACAPRRIRGFLSRQPVLHAEPPLGTAEFASRGACPPRFSWAPPSPYPRHSRCSP